VTTDFETPIFVSDGNGAEERKPKDHSPQRGNERVGQSDPPFEIEKRIDCHYPVGPLPFTFPKFTFPNNCPKKQKVLIAHSGVRAQYREYPRSRLCYGRAYF
jgi:hypothetical protein